MFLLAFPFKVVEYACSRLFWPGRCSRDGSKRLVVNFLAKPLCDIVLSVWHIRFLVRLVAARPLLAFYGILLCAAKHLREDAFVRQCCAAMDSLFGG